MNSTCLLNDSHLIKIHTVVTFVLLFIVLACLTISSGSKMCRIRFYGLHKHTKQSLHEYTLQ